MWRDQPESTGTTEKPRGVITVLHDLARTATPSLDSLVNALRKKQRTPQDNDCSVLDQDHVVAKDEFVLPDWAFTIALIYDSREISCVAHIPCLHPGDEGPHYLSFHFATLPFPSYCPDSCDVKSFVESRYRVAVALLSLQHHISRIAVLFQEVAWMTCQPDNTQKSVHERPPEKSPLGWQNLRCISPTVSETYHVLQASQDFAAQLNMHYQDMVEEDGMCSPIRTERDPELVHEIHKWYDDCAASDCPGAEHQSSLDPSLKSTGDTRGFHGRHGAAHDTCVQLKENSDYGQGGDELHPSFLELLGRLEAHYNAQAEEQASDDLEYIREAWEEYAIHGLRLTYW